MLLVVGLVLVDRVGLRRTPISFVGGAAVAAEGLILYFLSVQEGDFVEFTACYRVLCFTLRLFSTLLQQQR